MDKDNGPDTISLEDDRSGRSSTQVDDVFDPAVRVTLGWRDLEAAVEAGAVVPSQAHALWASWASLSSAQRVKQGAATKGIPIELLVPAASPEGSGSSPSELLGFTLAAALAGALLSYAFFAL